jgi:hypothetical protein
MDSWFKTGSSKKCENRNQGQLHDTKETDGATSVNVSKTNYRINVNIMTFISYSDLRMLVIRVCPWPVCFMSPNFEKCFHGRRKITSAFTHKAC